MTLTFEKKYLDLSGFSFNTSSKNRAGHCGNGLFTVCNAAPFASQALKVRAARLDERYGQQLPARPRRGHVCQKAVEYYPHLIAPQGETFKAFQQRGWAEITSLIGEALGPNVAVVTHAGFIRVVLTLLCRGPEPDVLKRTQGYAAVVTISENEMRNR